MTEIPRVVIVGSGPSGATAALILAERGIHVTLLESGQSFTAGLLVRAFGRNLFRKWAPDAERYQFVTSGDPTTEWQSALTPGGLSNYWTGAVPRFAPEDFTEGARLHERYRWPVAYDDLAPFYTYAERLLGVVGERRHIPQASAPDVLVQERRLPSAWRAVAGHAEEFNQGLWYGPLADGPGWTLRRAGVAFCSFAELIPRLRQFPNFELRLGAHAQRIIWNADLGLADGVEYVDRTTRRVEHIRATAVIVAAGPLASPKLLLQSTSGDFPTGLGNSQGVLGRFLHDHPKDWCVLELDRSMPRLDQPIHVSRLPYADSPPLMGATMTIGPLSKWDRLLSFAGATDKRFGLVTFATMVPEEHNQLRLHPHQRDQFGMPVLDIDIRYGPEVMQTIAHTHERFRNILAAAGIRARLKCPLDKLVPGSAAHYGGAARMHSSPRYGVLDGWNRLHDARNVAVVDASSFPTGVEKNPTLTAMALAARAADAIACDILASRSTSSQRTSRAVPSLRQH